MNILLINHYAGSIHHGMEYRPYYLARHWVSMGHQVTIIGGSYSHLRTEQPDVEGRITEQEIDGIRYVWIKTPSYNGNGVARALSMFAFVGKLVLLRRRFARQFKPDTVIASSTYPLDAYPARWIARASNAKLVYEVHDLWPLSIIELGGISPRHPFVALLQRAENSAYRSADRVISMLPNAREHMSQHGMAQEKFVHIPNGVDLNEWQSDRSVVPAEHVTALERLRDAGRFVVGYVGGHGVPNALDPLLEAAELLQADAKSVAFVLVGQGSEKQRLVEKARALRLKNTTFLPPVAKSSVPALLRSMDALYLGWRRKPVYRFGISPNKLMDYMMSGRPVVHSVEAANDLVAESACGVSCAPEDPAAIANAVKRILKSSPQELTEMGTRGKQYVSRYHDYRVLAQRFLEAID